ncbi:hypothetical protein [Raineyella sp. LH-20]|uniref:hypothetical protein n=1 Tax=Raineyella sp. LH-20 TaxID=3081204 RepID=UPI0029533266|nr:hypothetical protein [Raineyella sp. LH-20]WOP17950.1 hypothetical protein R0146_11995 [Raineyella sp. LH-20]
MPELPLPYGAGWFTGFLAALVYGLVGAVVPVANAEAYAVAAGALHPAGSVASILGLTLGQGIGKMAMFWGVRRGKDLPFFHPRRPKGATGDGAMLAADAPAVDGPGGTAGGGATPVRHEADLGPIRRWWSRTVRVSLRLVGDTRAGLPLVFAAAVVGFPPLYPVVLVAGASPIPGWSFGLVMSLGRGLRFALLAWGGSGLAGLLG